MLKNSLFQPSLSFSFNAAPFFFFSVSAFFFLSSSASLFSSFFCFCFPRYCFAPALFFFSLGVLPFIFQPKIPFFQPKRFSAFQPKNTFFSPKHFCFSLKLFSVQPKTFFFFFQCSHSSLLLFSALFFSGSALSFLFQCHLFFFSLAPFIQGPIFSLATSHLFYLNKSLFSSNLE